MNSKKLVVLLLLFALSGVSYAGAAQPTGTAGSATANQTIVEIAAANPDFSTLVTAVQAAGLVETLSGPGPFTVFAPTNAAFDKLPPGTLDALIANKTALTSVLTYHVVPGNYPASQVVSMSSLPTVQGQPLPVTVQPGGTVRVDGATVVTTDIKASNGVIHVIDTVMIPPAPTPTSTPTPNTTPTVTGTVTPGVTQTGGATSNQTIVEIAAANPNFSTLVTAVQAAGLVETLSGPGPFTVFAPTNAAFDKLPPGTLDALIANKTALTSVLTYHVVPGNYPASQVVSMSSLPTVQGQPLPVTVQPGGTVRVDGATVVTTDIKASNGVIHVIDTVMIPPAGNATTPTPTPITTGMPVVPVQGGSSSEDYTGGGAAAPTATRTVTPGATQTSGGTGNQTIVEIAAANPNFSTLVTAVQAAGLVETLSGPGPFTVFAPTNAAFDKLPPGTLDALIANKTELTRVLTYHVAAGRYSSDNLTAMKTVKTLEGQNVNVTVEAGRVRVDGAMVTQADIQGSNGVVHVIDAVMIPPAGTATPTSTPTSTQTGIAITTTPGGTTTAGTTVPATATGVDVLPLAVASLAALALLAARRR